MMVLISPEGYDKSSLFEAMCPAKTYFTDSLVLTKTKAKDIIEDVTGKCIAEASDLSGLSGASREDIKNFLARSVDRGRVAYARKTVEIPRAWVAAGTTNRPEFLSGTDGNRRFWGVEVQRVKIDAFRKYAPLLLGEAYQRHVIDGPAH
jgi:putative DNA primase/helicase